MCSASVQWVYNLRLVYENCCVVRQLSEQRSNQDTKCSGAMSITCWTDSDQCRVSTKSVQLSSAWTQYEFDFYPVNTSECRTSTVTKRRVKAPWDRAESFRLTATIIAVHEGKVQYRTKNCKARWRISLAVVVSRLL